MAAASACLCAAACGGARDRPVTAAASVPSDWRAIATQPDRDRLRNTHDIFVDALAEVRVAGREAELRQQNALFDPDHALAHALPPPGAYRCRTFKLGARNAGGLAYVAYPWFDCWIEREGDLLSLHKQTGSQRPVGLIFADTDARAIFLGTLVLGDETAPLQYGLDPARDMAGIVERVAERRWRLTLPAPAFESKLDVVELVPAG